MKAESASPYTVLWLSVVFCEARGCSLWCYTQSKSRRNATQWELGIKPLLPRAACVLCPPCPHASLIITVHLRVMLVQSLWKHLPTHWAVWIKSLISKRVKQHFLLCILCYSLHWLTPSSALRVQKIWTLCYIYIISIQELFWLHICWLTEQIVISPNTNEIC